MFKGNMIAMAGRLAVLAALIGILVSAGQTDGRASAAAAPGATAARVAAPALVGDTGW
ncbi:hypothetical protein [Kitasatospora viridis]|uniref:Uncharacterized protein n=1 Tax=Kitasatospora viridis TaxID=281105 RepID=A0A561TSS9_9ACTN|nr:hypothetical protein [Kitasatospora viridis]TWF90162.1 hypothetical protein FHX73_13206 [Kitasatospora viridis]